MGQTLFPVGVCPEATPPQEKGTGLRD